MNGDRPLLPHTPLLPHMPSCRAPWRRSNLLHATQQWQCLRKHTQTATATMCLWWRSQLAVAQTVRTIQVTPQESSGFKVSFFFKTEKYTKNLRIKSTLICATLKKTVVETQIVQATQEHSTPKINIQHQRVQKQRNKCRFPYCVCKPLPGNRRQAALSPGKVFCWPCSQNVSVLPRMATWGPKHVAV